jgi:hypothetical protein
MLKVQQHQCATCIYRPESPLDLQRLEAEIADPHMAGFFAGHRICHQSENAVCAEFWARYKDAFTVGQVVSGVKVRRYYVR